MNLNFKNNNYIKFDTKNIKYKISKNSDWKSIQINNNDIKTLNNKQYINDEIMNGMAKLLITNRNNYNKNIMFIDSLQFNLLINNFKNRLKKKFQPEFLKSDIIIVLRNIQNHWISYGIQKNNNNYDIYIMDSLQSYTTKIDTKHKDIINLVLNLSDDNCITSVELKLKDVPQQPNTFDCGIFSLLNISYYANNKRKFNYENPCSYRYKIKQLLEYN